MIFQPATTRGLDATAVNDGSINTNTVLLNHQISNSQTYNNMQNNVESSDDFLQQIMQQYMLQAAAGAGGGLFPDQNAIVDPFDSNHNPADIDASLKALFNGSFSAGSLSETSNQHTQHVTHPQDFGGGGTSPPTSQATTPTGGVAAAGGQPRQRVRARRGQATDPHSIAERLRRERIAERMKALQELVPNANKTDKASMLDEIIDYVKFLQLQVKVLSMSRLGGAAAVAPLVADMSSPEGRNGSGTQTASSSKTNDGLTVTEQQVAKLMEQDMGSAMQYLQSKGLCLMPISLATAISTATSSSSPSKQPTGRGQQTQHGPHVRKDKSRSSNVLSMMDWGRGN